MTLLPWVAIFAAAGAAWTHTMRPAVFPLLLVGYGLAIADGRIAGDAWGAIALLAAAGYAVTRPSRPVHIAGHVLFVFLAAALALHLVAGFDNALVIDAQRITPDALPFSMYLNLDKPLIGFWLLLAWGGLRLSTSARACARGAAIGGTLAALLCLSAAAAMGMIDWAPKWPHNAWLWLINNALLVVFVEEALFRGYVQGSIERWLAGRPLGPAIAILIAALLFGLAHAGGGWQWAVLATLAGLGYGVSYRAGGLQAAMLAHLGVNLLHYGAFTYPMRAL